MQQTEASKIGQYLKKKREQAGMSFREAAKAACVSHTHIMEIEAGKKSATFVKIMRILKAYHADIQEFLWETGYLRGSFEPAKPGVFKKVPLISWAELESWPEKAASSQSQSAQRWVNTTVTEDNIFALPVKDNSMEPEFSKGDTIVIDPNRKRAPNRFVIATGSDGKSLFRQYVVSGKTAMLHSLNQKFKDIELEEGHGYRIIGVMVESSKKYK